MQHLTETHLNEYLDNAMEDSMRAQAEAHLAECVDCQARLAALQAVFQALAGLPEEAPRRDLTPVELQTRQQHFSSKAGLLALVFQTGLSMIVLWFVFPLLASRIAGIIPTWNGQVALPAINLPALFEMQTNLFFPSLPHLPKLSFPAMPTSFNFPIWVILLIAAVMLFAIGNFSLIFHSTSHPRK
ncbi:MAG TPA: zf-HC2 domain-containing protein [Anaerolineales bacterium]|nr:zf-HC2 domain-containing protein [Anaerolineales bacterium]